MGAALGAAAGISLYSNLSGLFIKPLAEAFGWGRGQIALGAVGGLIVALTGPWLGAAVDRWGARRFILAGGFLFALAYLMLAAMPGAFWVYLLIMVFIGLLAGPATAPLVFTKPLVAAFERDRGLALAIGISGNAFAAIAVLPILQHVIASHGWRAGFLMMAPIALAAGLASWHFLGRADRGASASPGAVSPAPAEEPSGTAREAPGLTVKAAIRQSRFWLLALCIVAVSIAISAFSTQLQPLLSDRGIPGTTAAWLGSWYVATVVIGRLACGLLLDRIWPPGVAFVAMALPILGASAFLLTGAPFWLLVAGATLIGLSQGADGDVLAYFVARYFGLRSYGVTMGLLGLVAGLALVVGAVLGGLVFDRTGGYGPMIWTVMIVSGVAAASILASGLVRGPQFAAPSAATVEEAATEMSPGG
jgi:predicted MFS family arabinose efflux permease